MMNSGETPIGEVAGYELTGLIGSGGMGDVYKAYNKTFNRFAAVKILHQQEFAERFKNEAYIQSSVRHPNIARLYEYATIDGKPCIIMEYVEGESLDAILRRKGRLANELTENILRQVVSALVYLHGKGIIHRDIKPQNFKMQADGMVKMLDFGIAKNKYSPKLTQLGFVVGTLDYVAPEQFEQHTTLKSDVWALGVMTYELVTGYMPFEASNPVSLRSRITKGSFTNPSILIPEISEKLSGVIDGCLRVNPGTRLSAIQVWKILGRNDLRAHRRNFSLDRFFNRKGLLTAAAIVLLLLVFFSLSNNRHGEQQYSPATDSTGMVTDEKQVMINASGIVHADLIFNNDSIRRPLPYAVHGKEGDKLEFTIHADGYKDKKVQIEITSRRSSYEFNLEKVNF
jgi:eukaryotic-like serine/threonine-protein kinase